MARHDLDKSSKWMLQHYSRGVLLLGGLQVVQRAWALQAEVVQPRQLPDGLLGVEFKGRKKPHYVVVEVETYASKKVEQQAVDDLMLVYQDRRIVPEVLVVVLRPKGKVQVDNTRDESSLLRTAGFTIRWQVVKLWEQSAQDLLATNDVGVVPWVPLTQFDGPPENVLEDCRQRIERQARREEQGNLLAVTQVLTCLRFPAPELLNILGGRKIMIESPLLRELINEVRQDVIIRFLRARFGSVPDDLIVALQSISSEKQLNLLVDHAAICSDLEAFRSRLTTS